MLTEMLTREIGKMIKLKVKVSIFIWTGQFMMENGLKINKVDSAMSSGLMERLIQVFM